MDRIFVGDKRMETELHRQESSDQFVALLWPTRYMLYSTLYYRRCQETFLKKYFLMQVVGT